MTCALLRGRREGAVPSRCVSKRSQPWQGVHFKPTCCPTVFTRACAAGGAVSTCRTR